MGARMYECSGVITTDTSLFTQRSARSVSHTRAWIHTQTRACTCCEHEPTTSSSDRNLWSWWRKIWPCWHNTIRARVTRARWPPSIRLYPSTARTPTNTHSEPASPCRHARTFAQQIWLRWRSAWRFLASAPSSQWLCWCGYTYRSIFPSPQPIRPLRCVLASILMVRGTRIWNKTPTSAYWPVQIGIANYPPIGSRRAANASSQSA